MQEKFKDILSHLSTDVDQETLLLYLQNRLSSEKMHEVEKQLLGNEFASDAAEGLRAMRDQQRISHLVELLNRDLRKKLRKRKLRRENMTIAGQPWLYVSVLILILLIVLAYFVIRRLQ
ncbi:MAG TPA: hypothetical protein VEB63_01705 [Chitinophagaceae bacterium]|nr:hypothetical protein [Chitinophagaceae bacterium]